MSPSHESCDSVSRTLCGPQSEGLGFSYLSLFHLNAFCVFCKKEPVKADRAVSIPTGHISQRDGAYYTSTVGILSWHRLVENSNCSGRSPGNQIDLPEFFITWSDPEIEDCLIYCHKPHWLHAQALIFWKAQDAPPVIHLIPPSRPSRAELIACMALL